jgi:lipopolysaccharide heptosyltransferase II
MKETTWSDARNVLCVRLDYMGDVLMATPAIRAVRESAAGRRITLLTSGGGAAVASRIPEVDDIIEYAAPWMKSSAPHAPDTDLAMIRTLQSRRFDAAVIFTTYSQSALPAALLCQLAGIPLRLAHCRENPYQMLTHWVRESEPHQRVRHEVRRQLDLVEYVGCRTPNELLSFRISAEDAAWAGQRLQAIGIDSSCRWILLHPGATAASRRYPPKQWAAVARELVARLDFPLVFTGDANERELVDEIRSAVPGTCHSLAGELDIGKLGAVVARASVMISNNTGPAHIAAAVGTPLIDLYALTNPQHTPWQVPHRVLYHMVPCRNCYQSICPQGHHDCLTKVMPERVVDATVELLTERPGSNRSLATTPPIA